MTTSSEIVLVGGVVKSLNEFHSWSGETHIQKTCYVAKHVEKIPFKSEFILYKHGPYSFELNSALGEMRAQRIINVTPQSFGSTFAVAEGIWSAVNKASGDLYGKYRSNIDFVCSILAKKKVAELERVVTAVYVYVNFPELELDQMADKLVSLKPHIPPSEALEAFRDAEVFTKKFD